MENLAERITIFLAAHNYIAEDKKDWCHYVVHRIHCDFRLLRKYCFFPYPFVCQMQVCLYLLQLYPDFLLP